MCEAITAAASPGTLSSSHFFRVRALSMVSAVVKVFDTMTTSVDCASRPSTALRTSMGSTLARNLVARPCAATAPCSSVRKASNTNSGPR